MAQLDTELKRCEEAMKDICASPSVEGFNVGYTRRSIKERRQQYRAPYPDYRCLVMLSDGLTRQDAQDLEERLCREASTWDKWRSGDGHHRRSAGGVGEEGADELIHGVYIAWW